MLDSYNAYYKQLVGTKLNVKQVNKDITIHTPEVIAEKVYSILKDPAVTCGEVIEIL
jgi:hypothetical protein